MFFKKFTKNRPLRTWQKPVKNRARSFIKIFFLIIAVFLGLYLLNRAHFLFVRNIEFENQANCADLSRIEAIILSTRPNMVFVNNYRIKKEIFDNFLCISKIELVKKFPNKLLIKIEGRKPAILIKKFKFEPSPVKLSLEEASISSHEAKPADLNFDTAIEEDNFLADADGFIYSKETIDGLARADFLNFNLELGKYLPEGIVEKILFINEEIPKISSPISRIRVWGNRIITESEPKITLSAVKDIKRQLASLQLIFQKARMDSKMLESVDLRFDKPVIVYKIKS